jgi:spoIIIJ-associated protein
MSQSPKETLELMLGHLGFVFEVEEEDRPSGYTLHIRTRNPSRLIGREGKTLEELQFLLNRMLSSHHEESTSKIIIDVENYRAHQQDELVEHVKHWIGEIRKTGKAMALPPMNSFDRRIVHLTCQAEGDIEAFSPDEPMRLKSMTLRKKATTPAEAKKE